MENKPVVTITGVSGYLGSHVCLYFLKSGEFKVRGTVRSKTNAKKIEPLKKAFGRYFDELELVEADLKDAQSLTRAIEGSEYVVHTASPTDFANKDPNAFFKPAVEGTLAIMKACRVNKVKRVVMTSSIAAIMNTKEKQNFYNEETWSDPTCGDLYMQSKTRSEKAAWDFVRDLPADEKLELATIVPTYIIGPPLVEGDYASGNILKAFMLGKMPGCPKIMTGCIDVRDCAEAHFQALTFPEAAGKRYLLSTKAIWMKEIGDILHKEFGAHYKISRGDMPKCLAWVGSIFSDEMALMYSIWGWEQNLGTDNVKKYLKLKPTPIEKSLIEMGHSLIDKGIIPNKLQN